MIKYSQNRSKRITYILILFGIFLFHIYWNYHVLNKSDICREYDDAGRLTQSVEYYDLIFLESKKFQNIQSNVFKLIGQAHPPFVDIIGAMVCRLLVIGDSKFDETSIILFINMFFLFILLISVYCIGSTLYNPNVGILSAFLVSFFPMVYGHSRNGLLDFPLACMVSLSFCLLFKTNKFQSIKYSILLGIILGLSQLTKEAFIIFIFFPFVYYFYESYRNERKKRIALNFTLALLCAILVAGIVYLRPDNFFHALRTYTGKVFFLLPQNSKPILYYFKNIPVFTGTYIAVTTIPLLISYFLNWRLQNKVLFLWISVPLIIFSLSPNKAYRFLIPVLPAFALIVTQELFSSKLFERIKGIYLVSLILIAISQYSIYFFNLSFKDPYFFRKYYDSDFPGILTYQRDEYYREVSKLLEIFRQEKIKYDRRYRVLFLFDIGRIHSPLNYKFQLERLPFFVDCPQVADEVDAPTPGTINWAEQVLYTGYIIDKSEYRTIGRGGGRENIEGQLREGFREYRANFKKIADIQIFDGSHIYIYKNIKLE